MSTTIPPLSSREPARAELSRTEQVSAPVGIAAAQTTITSSVDVQISILETVCRWIYDVLMAIWECISACFTCAGAERVAEAVISPDEATWNEMVASAQAIASGIATARQQNVAELTQDDWMVLAASQLYVPESSTQPQQSLNNETLQRICAPGRTFSRTVETNLFETNYSSMTRYSDTDNVFAQLDLDLQRNAGVFIGQEQFTDSRGLLDALQARNIDEVRAKKILSCLSQGACAEAWVMMKRLFANIEPNVADDARRHPAKDPSPFVYKATLDFDGPMLSSIQLGMNFLVNSLDGETLFKVSTLTRINGETGHAVITGTTSAV